MEAVGLAASIASLVQIAASIAKLTYSYGAEVANARETQKRYVQEVSAFISVLLRSQQALLDSEASGLTQKRPISLSDDIIKSCHGELKILEGDLSKRTSRLMWPFLEKDLQKHIDTLTRLRQIFSDYLSSVILDSSVVTYKKLQQVAFEQKKQQLLMLLGNDECSRAKPKACPGTGLWFLRSEEFKSWCSQQGGLLWCFGAPGVGKSLLASIVIDNLREQQGGMPTSIAYYFCEFSSRNRQTPLAILQSLLRQLVEQAGEDVVTKMSTVISDPIKRAKEEDLCKILAEACSLHPSYLIIDAPDELEYPRRLLSYVQPLVDSKARIIIMSRDIPEMRRFPTLSRIKVVSELEDIEKYLKAQFEHHELLDDEDPSESDSLISNIVSKSGDIFLLAKLLADNVLEQQTLRQMRNVAETFPDSLEAAYDATLERIDTQPKTKRALARRLLAWTTRSMRRLRIEEVIEAFAVEEDADEIAEDNKLDAGRLLSTCYGILSVNKDDSTVGFIHTTAHEFFTKASSDTDAHADMANTCLLYLNLRPLREEIFFSAAQLSRQLESMPFLAYAASFWGSHVKSREAERNSQSRIIILLKNRCARSNAFQALNFPKDLPEDLIESVFSSIPTWQEPLHISAYWNLQDTTLQLLQEDADASAPDSQKWTPLHWACCQGHLDVAAILLRHHVKVDAVDSQGWTPLFWAAFHGHTEVMCLLLDHGANHLHRSALGWTALHWAVSKRHHETVEAILRHHKSSNWAKAHPSTRLRNLTYQDAVNSSVNAVEIAASIGDTKIFDALTNCLETDRSISNNLSFNKIWSAEKFDHPIADPWRTARMKVRRHNGTAANETMKDTRDWKSKLLLSAIKDKRMDIAKILIHNGADVNYYNQEVTPLHAAVLYREPEFCRQFIQMGARLEAVDERGFTPLYHAALNGDIDVVRTLLQSGSNANARAVEPAKGTYWYYNKIDANSPTPLILVCGFLSDKNEPREELVLQLAVLLIQHGADVNLTDKKGRTALHYAIINPYSPLIERLLKAGARSDLQDMDGWTPFHDLAAAGNITEHGYEWLSQLLSRLLESSSDQNADRILNLEAKGKPYYQYQRRERQGQLSDGINAAPKPVANPVTLALENAQWGIFRVFRELGGRIPPSQDLNCSLHLAIRDMKPDMVVTLLDHGAIPRAGSMLDLVKSLTGVLTNGKPDAVMAERFLLVLRSLNSANVEADALDEISWSSWSGFGRYFFKDEDEDMGMTALVLAAGNVDNEEVIEALVQSGANPMLASAGSFNSIVTSAVHARTDSLRVLIRHIGATSELSHLSSDYEKLCCRLSREGNINATTRTGRTVLHLAAAAGNHELVSRLLEYGADAYATDKRSLMPAHHASMSGDLETLKLLCPIENRNHSPGPSTIQLPQIDLDMRAWWGHPILYVAVLERRVDVAQYLIQLGANTAREGEQPEICVAVQKGYDDVVAVLLDAGVSVDSPDTDGWTALHYAAHEGSEAVTRALLSRGASMSATTRCWGSGGSNGRQRLKRIRRDTPWMAQPLHVAAISGKPSIVRLLLQHGADVNARADTEDYGPTALHMALHTGDIGLPAEEFGNEYLQVAQALVEADADVSGVADGFTIENVLKFKGYEDLWDKLRVGITR